MLGGPVYSTYVNINGNIIYAATGYGCKQIDWNGSDWILNSTSFLSVLGTNTFMYLTFI